MTVAGNNKRE